MATEKQMKAIEAAQAARRKQAESGDGIKHRTPTEKLQDNPTSRKLAIDAMCYECQGGGADAGTKWSVGNCPCTNCPLHAVRPWQHLNGTQVPRALRTGHDQGE